jgi:peptidoglycan/LPS O-acetylase OafA/YrhL
VDLKAIASSTFDTMMVITRQKSFTKLKINDEHNDTDTEPFLAVRNNNNYNNFKKVLTLIWLLSPDIIAVLINFLIFYNDFENKKTLAYQNFEDTTLYYVLPFLFALLMFIAMFQSKTKRISLFIKFCESRIIVLIGECSLALYVVQNVFINFYFKLIMDHIHQKYPHFQPTWYLIVFGLIIGISLVIGTSVFIQKIYQEKWMTWLHIYLWKKY